MFTTFSKTRPQRFVVGVILSAVCLATLVGCRPPSPWVAKDSSQGQVLEQIAKEGRKIDIVAPLHAPLRFEGVRVEERYVILMGAQYRAMLKVQPKLTGDAFDRDLERWVETVRPIGMLESVMAVYLHVEYEGAMGERMGSERILIDPYETREVELVEIGKYGAPHRITVSLDSVLFTYGPRAK